MKFKPILLTTGIYPPDIGGPATQVKNVENHFLENDFYKFDIITYGDKNEILNTNFNLVKINKYNFFLLKYFDFFLKTLKYGKDKDIIYCQGAFTSGIPTYLANIFLRKKFIIRMGGDFVWEYSINNLNYNCQLEEFKDISKSFRLNLMYKVQLFVLKKADKIIVPTNYFKNILVNLGLEGIKIVVVRNYFNDVSFNTIKKTNKVKKLLYVGRLIDLKNIDLIIKAIKNLVNVNFEIVGDGPNKSKLIDLVKRLNLEDRVKFLGKKNKLDLIKIYKNSDILVLLSDSEVSPNVFLEAMNFNLKIISSKNGGGEELIKDYNSKIIVSDLKSETLVHSINDLINLDIKPNSNDILKKHLKEEALNDLLGVLYK